MGHVATRPSSFWLVAAVLLATSLSLQVAVVVAAPPSAVLNSKQQYICSLSGGLDVVRLSSSTTRLAFKGALEDVEFVRQYVAEAARNRAMGSSSSAGMTLDELSQTLDAPARNISAVDHPNATTVTAGLGYSDDRADRRIERYVGLTGAPFVGTKQTDLDLIEPVSNVFPWMVDRTTNVNHGKPSKAQGNRLYVAAWIGTRGEAWMYYPSLQTTNGHPLGFGDVLGPTYDSRQEEFVKPNLPPRIIQDAYFSPPYPDTAIPGMSLITAQAPIYYTGDFGGYSYNHTYIASTGVDISVEIMSSCLDDLEGTLTKGSFAMVVGAQGLHTILLNQTTVDKLYPLKTGMEESRVTYDTDGTIVKDRRNQPYAVSDTIFQPPTKLTNSPDWTTLASNVQALQPGERSSMLLNITLTGEEAPTSFYVMYERWSEVADWALLLFVPQHELDTSIQVEMAEPAAGNDLYVQVKRDDKDQIIATTAKEDDESTSTVIQTVLRNTGILDVTVSITKLPPWFALVLPQDEYKIPASDSLTLTYTIVPAKIPQHTRSASSLIALTIKDDGYGNCFYKQVITSNVFLNVKYEGDLNQLDNIRPYGLTLSAIIVLSAVGWSVWVILHASHRVVRAAQPIFLHMMCAGILVMGLSIIPLSIDDSLASEQGCTVACMAFPWLISIGFSIAYSALFSKIWRINQIVAASKNYQKVDVSMRDLMVPFLVICTLNVTILCVWSVIDPLIWVRESEDGGSQDDPEAASSGGSDDSYGYCSINDSVLELVCFILLMLVNFGALVLALLQLYRARELSTEYSEGKYIAIAMGSMIQVFLTGLPILIIVTDSPQVSYFVKSTIVFTVAMSLLLLTFVPKFYITSKQKDPRLSSHSFSGISRPSTKNGSNKRPMVSSVSDATSLPANSIVMANKGKKKRAVPEQSPQRRVMFSSSEEEEEDIVMQHHSRITAKSRPPAISDLSMSLTLSEYEQLEKSALEGEISEQFSAPKQPARMPSVMEDVSDHDRTRETESSEDMKDGCGSTCNAAIPKREPTLVELNSEVEETSVGPPLGRQASGDSRDTIASIPMRFPSLVEPYEGNDDFDIFT